MSTITKQLEQISVIRAIIYCVYNRTEKLTEDFLENLHDNSKPRSFSHTDQLPIIPVFYWLHLCLTWSTKERCLLRFSENFLWKKTCAASSKKKSEKGLNKEKKKVLIFLKTFFRKNWPETISQMISCIIFNSTPKCQDTNETIKLHN